MSWLLLQSGVGIECSGENFRAVAVKRQWKRTRILDWLEIPQYRELEPAECGRRYRTFLRKSGLKAPWTVVALPRSAALLRCLSFPQAVSKELARAVEYQLDALHPFEEGSVCWDFATWQKPEKSLWDEQEPGSGHLDVLVGIAQKRSVEETAAWFEEAGIGVSQFSTTASLLCGTLWPQVAEGARKNPVLFLLNRGLGSVELIGFAPGKEFLWKEIKIPGAGDEVAGMLQRELELARSTLRVDPQERPPLVTCGEELPETLAPADLGFTMFSIEQVFPFLQSGAAEFRVRENGVVVAAALAAADHSLPLSVNLLPAEKRLYRSPLAQLPTYALASLVVVLAAGLGVRGTVQDWLYAGYLDREIQALQPQIAQVETAQAKSRESLDRLVMLAGVKNGAVVPLEILQELTRLLPADTWLQQLQYEGETVTLAGNAASASGVLQTLSGSPYFESPQFTSSINRTPDGQEVFRIALRLRAGRGQ